jgi:hypothetical protein
MSGENPLENVKMDAFLNEVRLSDHNKENLPNSSDLSYGTEVIADILQDQVQTHHVI